MIVDSTQGVQSQTLANYRIAKSAGVGLICLLNKIDLENSDIEKTKLQVKNLFGMKDEAVICVSAKTGVGINEVLDTIVNLLPCPVGSPTSPLRCLLIDTWYDKYSGIVSLISIHDGSLRKGEKVQSAHSKKIYEITNIGIMYPEMVNTGYLGTGSVGFITMNMKSISECFPGDTFHRPSEPVVKFPLISKSQPMVFSGVYPIDANDFSTLAESLERLAVNDSSVSIQKETSTSLGQGFRLGFLGTLHMDVFRQRLEDEHDAVIINTSPSVPYIVRNVKSGAEMLIRNPSEFPGRTDNSVILEPFVIGTLIFPDEYLGGMMTLCTNHRGIHIDTNYIDDSNIIMKYKFPMSQILTKFYSSLKSISSGYASFEYAESGYAVSDVVKVDLTMNGKNIDSLATIVHRSSAEQVSKQWTSRLKGVIDRHLFDIIIQASVAGKVLTRETVKAVRKDVTAKCYGGDITRKMKLLEKQKKGKKRMKSVAGGIELSQEAFLALMTDD